MRAAPYCPGNTPPWYGRFTPAESTRYYRDALAHRDLLSAEHLLDRLRPPGARLHSGVVRHHHHRPAGDAPQTRDHTRPRRLGVVLVERDEQADFEPGRPLVEQGCDALPGGQLSLVVLAAHFVGPAALLEARLQLAVFRGKGLQAARGRRGASGGDGVTPRHARPPTLRCISPGPPWVCPVRTTARCRAGAAWRCLPEE